jgi:hypothetical protein
MSTLRVDNLQPSDGLSPAFSTVGVAKAAFVYDQDTPTVTRSNNISSVSDDATGLFTSNITNSFDAADYTTLLGTGEGATVGIRGICVRNGGTGKTTSACEFQSHTTAATIDLDLNAAGYQGDLA